MNTNEIKESAINLFWTFDKTLSDALDYAITEATAQLQKELEELALQIEKATPFIREIQKQNETLRNAQKSCASCDGPTLEQFKKMQAENLELRGKLSRECENHDACRIQVEQLQAEKVTLRESALRETINKIELRISILSALGCEKTYETAIHELRQRIEDIQSLITTPASKWEQHGIGHWELSCKCAGILPNKLNWKFCPYCGKPIAQVKGVGL